MIPRIEVLFDGTGGAKAKAEHPLLQAYGGALQLPSGVIANLVISLDGVVALGPTPDQGPGAISGKSPADRLVMALLRALSDAVLIGAETLRRHPGHQWTPEHLVPELALELRSLRRESGRDERWAPLVVVSSSGNLDPGHSGFTVPGQDVLLLLGAKANSFPTMKSIRTRGENWEMPAVIAAIEDALSAKTVLSEAGPKMLGQFLQAGCLDELFLSIAPRLAGSGAAGRISLLQDSVFPVLQLPQLKLVSLRRSEDDLLLTRYEVLSKRQ